MNLNQFIPEKDVVGKRPDGRSYLIVPAGTPITLERAKSLGLLEEEKAGEISPPEIKPGYGPQETKEKTNSSRPYEVTGPALRLAEDAGVDLSKVKGSGPGGKIVKKDVEEVI